MTDAMQKFSDERLAQLGPKKVSFKTLLDIIEVAQTALIKRLKPRLEALEKEVADLRVKSLADAFRGTWMPGTVFARGSLAVHDGSLWLAMVDSSEKPGASGDWKMVTKRGRDGKDLRP